MDLPPGVEISKHNDDNDIQSQNLNINNQIISNQTNQIINQGNQQLVFNCLNSIPKNKNKNENNYKENENNLVNINKLHIDNLSQFKNLKISNNQSENYSNKNLNSDKDHYYRYDSKYSFCKNCNIRIYTKVVSKINNSSLIYCIITGSTIVLYPFWILFQSIRGKEIYFKDYDHLCSNCEFLIYKYSSFF